LKNLKIIGITGTNGKTTTAFLIYHLLKKMGKKVSLVGTIKYIIGSKSHKAKLTTPGFIELSKILKKIKQVGSDFVVIEVSSHGIVQGRIKGLKFSRCLFTNLSRDHLDYHKTMKNYFFVKKKLFVSQKNAIALINIDDDYGKKIARGLKKASSFAIKSGADFRAENIVLGKKGSYFEIVSFSKRHKVKTRLPELAMGHPGVHHVLFAELVSRALAHLGNLPVLIATEVVPFLPVSGEDAAVGEICVHGQTTPLAKALLTAVAETPTAFPVLGSRVDGDAGPGRLFVVVPDDRGTGQAVDFQAVVLEDFAVERVPAFAQSTTWRSRGESLPAQTKPSGSATAVGQS